MSQQSGIYAIGSGQSFVTVPTPSGNNLSFFLNGNDNNKLYAMRYDRSVFLVPTGIAPVDNKVSVSLADTTPGFLQGKLAAGAGITLTVLNPGANESLSISASGGGSAIWSVPTAVYGPGGQVLYYSFFTTAGDLLEALATYKYYGQNKTLSDFGVKISLNTSTSATSLKIRVNGVDTGIEIIVPPAGTGFFADNLNTFAIVDGDEISISMSGQDSDVQSISTTIVAS